MSEAWPKPRMPRPSATCSGAGLSVCCVMMSTPWSINALAASASLAGSNQVCTQTTRTSASGRILRAANAVALIPITTSGIGTDAT